MSQKERPRAEILTVGDELLKGSTLNGNARFLGRALTELGFRVSGQTACPDEHGLLRSRLREAMERSQVLIVTGGLGPTPDDLTRDAIAAHFGVPLKESKKQLSRIRKFYKDRGRKIPEIVYREAQYPANGVPLDNACGMALGFMIDTDNCIIAVLPGVPREMEAMFCEGVKPRLEKRYPKLAPKYSAVLKTVGLSEPDVMKRLGRDFFRDRFDFGIYPSPSETAVRVQADSSSVLKRLEALARKRLQGNLYALEDRSLAETVGEHLKKRRFSLALAESCTAGLLASEIASCPGASDYFLGGIVSYSNASKERELDVPGSLLKSCGAVSQEAALSMASNVRRKFRSDFGISLTGVAGPGGGTKLKPVGLVWIAVAGPRGERAEKFLFSGARNLIRLRAVKKALELLWRELVPSANHRGHDA